MSDKNGSWNERLSSCELSRADIEMVASVLELVHALKPEAPPATSRPAASNLLFELASLQMETVKKLAEISAKQTGAMVDAIKARRTTVGSARGQPLRILVSPVIPEGSQVKERFVIRNDASCARGYPLPDVLHLERVDPGQGCHAGVFVKLGFTGDDDQPLPEQPHCAQPFFVNVPPTGSTGVKLVIPWDARLGPGRYRGVVSLEAANAPSAELIVELKVEKKE